MTISLSNRQHRIVVALSDIIEDRDQFDKATRKAAKKTDPRHVEAFMRLEDHGRDLESIGEPEFLREVEAAIVGIPPVYDAIDKLVTQLKIDEA